MELLLIALAAAAASAATLISGFGLSTALVPVFALYFPLPLAIGAVAVVHLLNSLFKVGIMRSEIYWPVALRFGVPAAAAALLGATLLGALGEAEPLARYSIGESSFQITPLKLVVGGVILALVALELSPRATTCSRGAGANHSRGATGRISMGRARRKKRRSFSGTCA